MAEAVKRDTLRERCKEFLKQHTLNGILRQGDPVEHLVAFVQSEQGRSADQSLEDTRSLILYFANDEDREEFKALIHEAKPGMVARNIP
jgi:hypothetical protein